MFGEAQQSEDDRLGVFFQFESGDKLKKKPKKWVEKQDDMGQIYRVGSQPSNLNLGEHFCENLLCIKA